MNEAARSPLPGELSEEPAIAKCARRYRWVDACWPDWTLRSTRGADMTKELGVLPTIRSWGITSDHMFIAGFASIGLTLISWMTSINAEDTPRADRWGIFIGEWAPTFFALGVALRIEETHPEPGQESMEETTTHSVPTRAGV